MIESDRFLSFRSALRQVDRVQIPDLPARIIAATALYLDVPIISCDRSNSTIGYRHNLVRAIACKSRWYKERSLCCRHSRDRLSIFSGFVGAGLTDNFSE